MQPQLDIDYSGLSRALRRFESKTTNPRDILASGLGVLEQAVAEPRASGALAQSRTLRFGPDYGELAWTEPYARFVHDGTRYMSANPYASRALGAKTDQVLEVMRDGIAAIQRSLGLK